MTSKVAVGDNFGTVSIVDTTRKIVVDRFKIPSLNGRRVLSISSATIDWVGTQLTYVAVVARGSPQVHILTFKHSDCKLKHSYSLNLIPELQNLETPELNNEQKYLKFPYEVKLSQEFAFMAVTLVSGEVKLFKMPSIYNPLEMPTQT